MMLHCVCGIGIYCVRCVRESGWAGRSGAVAPVLMSVLGLLQRFARACAGLF
jgi:hypothetical protein